MAEHGEVIFVGGAAFSGAGLVARLLDAHPRLVALPIAARFHSEDRGMPALLGGRVGLDGFLSELRGPWWAGSSDGEPGLGEVVARPRLEAEIERFRGSYHRDPLAACRELFLSLLVVPVAGGERTTRGGNGGEHEAGADARAGVSRGPVRARRSRRTRRRLGGGGRGSHEAVAAGIAGWTDELREIELAIRGEEDGAPYAMPPGRLGVVVLDQLAAGDREASYRALLALLALDDDPQMRSFLEHRLGPEEIGRGRWREHARGPAAWALRRRYRRALSQLERERNHAARPLLEAYERLG